MPDTGFRIPAINIWYWVSGIGYLESGIWYRGWGIWNRGSGIRDRLFFPFGRVDKYRCFFAGYFKDSSAVLETKKIFFIRL